MLSEYSFQMTCGAEIVPEKRTCYLYEERGKDGNILRRWFNGCDHYRPCPECDACGSACWEAFRASTL